MPELAAESIYVQKPAKILVIDDHESARALLKRRLSIYGYEVFAAEDAGRAMVVLSKVSADVIFLNMFINGESSYDFLKQLKENDAYKSIPIIMISSDSDVELIVRCIEAGAEDYLVKPLNQTLLRARLSNCVARKEAYDKEVAYLAKIEQGQKQIVAQEKMASIGVLVSSISQELKNPLNFVINFAEVSAEVCSEIDNKLEIDREKVDAGVYNYLSQNLKKFRSNVQKITEYGRNADQIIRFMLTQSSSSGGGKHPAIVNKIITQTINMLLSSYKKNGVTNLPRVETKFDTSIEAIPVSTPDISKMVYNILDNAIYSVMHKYHDIINAEIIVITENTPGAIAIKIIDNGSGIKESLRQKIFEPFFTTKPEGTGPGLGLSTANDVAADHNGTITVTSVEEEYAEFIITLNKTALQEET
ncbi:MAG: hybrid sensor histidine kinase/response regulator [Holosporaceae bacterium]|jgi:signal transduction histidine kinase|nr:hybrid sensor histidine kinase/response regulator [Holosporaceae bacterium]